MFIYYQNPYIDIISNIAAILYIIAILSGGLSVLDEIYKVKFALGLAFWTASSNMNEDKSNMDKNVTMNSDSSLTDMMDDTMKQLKEKGVL